jgi:hypothetical protein
MGKVLKIIGVGIALLLVIVVVLVGVGLSSLNGIVKDGIESRGPDITGSRVSLDGADIALMEGKGSLSGLVIGNPDGFSTGNAFSMGRIGVALNRDKVSAEAIEISEMSIENPELTIEFSGNRTNIQTLQDNIAAYAGLGRGGDEGSSGGGGGPRITIGSLAITGGKVAIAGVPGMSPRSLDLPDIHLSDIDGRNGGVTGAELAQLVLTQVYTAALEKARASGIPELRDLAGSQLSDARERMGDLSERIGGVRGAMGAGAENMMERIGEGAGGLRGLLPGGDQE